MNEMQQTLEDWADNLIALYGKRMNQVAQWTAREAIKARLQQAYEAGESAMKELTARMAECVDPEGMVMTAMLGDPPTNCRVKLADAIRALALSSGK